MSGAPIFHGLVTETHGSMGWAVFDEPRLYRYALGRVWRTDRPPLVWCLQNPSTAGARQSDATLRRGIGFAVRWGYGSVVFVNRAASIATDVSALEYGQPDVELMGPRNPEVLRWACNLGRHAENSPAPEVRPAAIRIAAWGAMPGWFAAATEPSVTTLLEHGGLDGWQCLGLTKGNEPRHPLRLPYATPLRAWVPSQEQRAAAAPPF